jgi:hypothetical protein
MRKTMIGLIISGLPKALGAAGLAFFIAQAPADAAGGVSAFKVTNCTTERMFVCSFDKTDRLMNIPYDAKGLKPDDKKAFACASLGRCKVIIGVSKEKKKRTLSAAMTSALAVGAVSAVAVAGVTGQAAYTIGTNVAGQVISDPSIVFSMTSRASSAVVLGVTTAVVAVAAIATGGAVAGIEIKDGWKDGEVCKEVRRAAEKAGLKPRDFAQNNADYVVVPKYATDDKGNPYVNADGTAVFAYAMQKGDSCPAPLKTELVPD